MTASVMVAREGRRAMVVAPPESLLKTLSLINGRVPGGGALGSVPNYPRIYIITCLCVCTCRRRRFENFFYFYFRPAAPFLCSPVRNRLK